MNGQPQVLLNKHKPAYTTLEVYSFSWITELFKRGAEKTLELDDLEPVPEKLELTELETRIMQAWEKEKVEKLEPNLSVVLRKEFLRQILADGSFKLVGDLLNVASPLFLNFLVTYIGKTKSALANGTEVPPLWIGAMYSVSLLVIALISSIFNNQQIQRTTVFSLNIRYALVSIIYKKSMKLSYLSRQSFDSAKIVSMVSIDCFRIEQFLTNINYIWTAPIQVVITIALLLYILGWPCLIGLIVLVLIYPCQVRKSLYYLSF
jgi:ATP-binding cassette subfamily C (CFTR/MRP) protein 1